MTQGQKTQYELGLEVINSLAKEFDPRTASNGVSYFKGKNRLCKILNSKKGIRLELNILVPEAIEKKHVMVRLAEGEAKKKHLGTMKYSVIALDDTGALKEVITEALKAFKATFEAPEVKPEVPAEPEAKKVDLTKKEKQKKAQ